MILNLYGETESGKTVFRMPNILLDPRLHYQVGVSRIYFNLDTKQSAYEHFGNHDLLMINSNLVDRSAANPHQALVYFDFSKRDKLTQSFYTPSIIFQPLQLRELSNASFIIRTVSGEAIKANYKTLFIQLEIKRSDTYGWL